MPSAPASVPAATDPLPVTLADVRAAAARIEGAVVRTPTLYSRTLSRITGAEVWCKFENLQFTAAYKERGALNTLLTMGDADRAKGVIAASAGNHAQGLAYHAHRLGVPATIVMPVTAPVTKVVQTESHGATVVLHGERFDDAYAHARVLEEERGFTFVHPFDQPSIMAGQGTVALEMLADAPELETLVVPVGGGGLLAGMGVAARGLNPDIDLVGVESELYPSMLNALDGGDRPTGGDTLGEGIAVSRAGTLTPAIVRALGADLLLVSERHLERAVSLLVEIEKTVVEGAGAAGLAALLAHPERFRGRRCGLVLCGGNIDTRLLANVLIRDLARHGRIARLRVELHDRAGALVSMLRIVSEQGANIMEVVHQRIFTSVPAKDLMTEIECETRDHAHLDRLVSALRDGGYSVDVVDVA